MATVLKTFAKDFERWAVDLIDRGVDTPEGIAEIRAAIREAFETSPEAAAYWQQRIASEAALIRNPHAKSVGIAERCGSRAA